MSKLSKALKKAERGISGVIPHQHSADRRAAAQAAAEEIRFYQEQRRLLEEEASRTAAEREVQERKVQKKQIRGMRNAYRRPGFMEEPSSDYQSTLA